MTIRDVDWPRAYLIPDRTTQAATCNWRRVSIQYVEKGSLRSGSRNIHQARTVHAHGLRNVLDLLITHVREKLVDLAVDLLEDRTRDVYTTLLGESLQTRCDVDTIAKYIIALDDHVAKVDANTKHNSTAVRNIGIAHSHAALNSKAALHSINGACEFDQQAVTHLLYEPPMKSGYRRVDELTVMAMKGRQRSGFVGSHESAVTHNIRAQNSS